jgi:hypothetical protein
MVLYHDPLRKDRADDGELRRTPQPPAALPPAATDDLSARLAGLEAQVESLQTLLGNQDELAWTMAPALGEAIRRQTRDAPQEMIEALYPVVGELVVRAVGEAIRDLARNVDARLRRVPGWRVLLRRMQARAGGVTDSELLLREAVPFRVTEAFLIHRESGLLLGYVSSDPASNPNSDLISGMLTAIRDFARDAFGRGQRGQLDEIQYGALRILTEATQHVVLAVVVDGIEPAGLRARMRDVLLRVESSHRRRLLHYDGDATPFSALNKPLRALMSESLPTPMHASQKVILALAAGLMLVCLGLGCSASTWAWRTLRATAFAPAPGATRTPALSAVPTQTAITPSVPSVQGVMTGHVWVREGPSRDYALLGVIAQRGEVVEILAVFGEWYLVRRTSDAQARVLGWVPGQWVGTTEPIPQRIVTPTPVAE